MTKRKIGVLGAGTWGMALARMLTVSGNEVQVWSAIEAEVDNLSTTRVHPNLPGMKIPAELQFTKSIEEVCTGKDVLLFAVPSVFVRGTTAKARPYIPDGQILVDVAKGMEPDTLYTMTEVIADELNRDGGPKNCRLVALSGPTHAEEVALDLPTTIVSACPDDEAARFVQDVFSNTCMRVYTNPDIKGVELSGAMKNVIALGVVRQAKDRDAALAYALGFVCHFALDSTCHPYVEAYTRQSGVSHCEIETEFDDMLLRRDGHDPKSFFTASHIRPTAENARVIAPFYEGLTGLQVLDALKGMIAMHRLLQPSGAVKRWVVLTGMKAVGKYDVLHGLVANPQPNPQCTESNEKLDALYQQAIPLAVRLIEAYAETLDTDEPLDKAYDHTFGEF